MALAPAFPGGLLPGTLLDHERYIIDGVLGCGGFGITYLATHRELQQCVAIKEFYPSAYAARDPATGELVPRPHERDVYRKALHCFIREGRLLAKLNHYNIVRVTNLFQERHTAYLVMELIEGQTLASRLQDHQPLREPLVCRIMAQLVDALATIHRQGICHLDIKPDNIMLTGRLCRDQTTISAPGDEKSRMSNTEDGRVVLLDFGAARQVFATTSDETSVRFGTPGNSPPEMLKGEDTGPESDIFEAGVLLHQLLTGVRPPPVIERLSEDRWTADGLPEPWRGLCASALQLDRENRPHDIQAWWNSPGIAFPQDSTEPIPTAATPAQVDEQPTIVTPPLQQQPTSVMAPREHQDRRQRTQPSDQQTAHRQEIDRLLHKADSMFLQDHETVAIATWRRVLALDPANETALRGIARAQVWLSRRHQEEEARTRLEAAGEQAEEETPSPPPLPLPSFPVRSLPIRSFARRPRKNDLTVLWISLAIATLVVLWISWPYLVRRVITTTVRQPIPYPVQTRTTGSGSQQELVMTQKGANGVKELTVRVTYNGRGTELKREILRSRVIKAPTPKIIVVKRSLSRQELMQSIMKALFGDLAMNLKGALHQEYQKDRAVLGAVSRGLACEQRAKFIDAERAYQEAVAVAEQEESDDIVAWQPYLHLGRILARQGKYERALYYLQIYYARAEWKIEGIATSTLLTGNIRRLVQADMKHAAVLIGILQLGLEAKLPSTYDRYVLYTENGDVDGDHTADTVQVVSPDSSNPYISSQKYIVISKGYTKTPKYPKRWVDSLGTNCVFNSLMLDGVQTGILIRKDANDLGFVLIFTPGSGDFADFAYRSGGFVSLGGGL